MRFAQSSPAEEPLGRSLLAGGTRGNELLTTLTGAVLFVLLAALGVTIIALGPLLSLHLFIGMLLLGPIALKMASTGYRFLRYYSGNRRYREVGPPPTPMRLIAPVVVLSTVVVMVSGVALLFIGPGSRAALLPVHKVSFIVWIAFTSIHVLWHLPALARLSATRRSVFESASGAARIGDGELGRGAALTSSLTLGFIVAIASIPQFSPWLSANFHHH